MGRGWGRFGVPALLLMYTRCFNNFLAFRALDLALGWGW